MRMILGKLIFLISFLAQLDPQYQEAGDNLRRGLLETPMMKQELIDLQNDSERYVYVNTGLTKDDLALGAYVYPLIVGKISTKPFKNFKHVTENNWTFRPEFEYTISDQTTSTFLFITKEF